MGDPGAASNAQGIEQEIAKAVDHLIDYENNWLANRMYDKPDWR